jgi:hypothetical protein
MPDIRIWRTLPACCRRMVMLGSRNPMPRSCQTRPDHRSGLLGTHTAASSANGSIINRRPPNRRSTGFISDAKLLGDKGLKFRSLAPTAQIDFVRDVAIFCCKPAKFGTVSRWKLSKNAVEKIAKAGIKWNHSIFSSRRRPSPSSLSGSMMGRG